MDASLPIFKSLKRSINRLNAINDPVVRYGMFLEIMRFGMDAGFATVEMKLYESIEKCQEELDTLAPEKEQERIKLQKKINVDKSQLTEAESLKTDLDKYYDGFSEYIQSPMYDINHPIGEKMMKSAQKDLENQTHLLNSS